MSGSGRCRGNWNATSQSNQECPLHATSYKKRSRETPAESSDHLRNSICVVDYPSKDGVPADRAGRKAQRKANPRMTQQHERGGPT
jgi:hypothetical protein